MPFSTNEFIMSFPLSFMFPALLADVMWLTCVHRRGDVVVTVVREAALGVDLGHCDTLQPQVHVKAAPQLLALHHGEIA